MLTASRYHFFYCKFLAIKALLIICESGRLAMNADSRAPDPNLAILIGWRLVSGRCT
jgi:hypothetical protein